MPTVTSHSQPIDELMFLLVARRADSTLWGAPAFSNAAGDDDSRADVQPDLAPRGCVRERGRSW